MKNFKYIPLKQLIKNIKVGFVGSIEQYYCDKKDGVLLLRTSNLTKEGIDCSDVKYVTREFYEKNKKSQLHKNDILIARHGDNGKANIYMLDEEAQALNVVIIEPDENKMSPTLIKYFFESPFVQKQINGGVGGSVQGVINTKQIADLLIPYSEDIDYKKVDELLTAIDSKISNNKKIIEELSGMLNHVYDCWFLNFEFPDKNGNPYKSSGGEMQWIEEFSMSIPKGWDVSTLKGKYEIVRGISYTSKDIESGKGIPMINLACIDTNRNYRDGELKYYNGIVDEESLLDADDLLIACTDLTRNADIVGSPILVPDDEKYTFSMDIVKLIPNEKIFNKYYLYMALRTRQYHSFIKKWASGTNVLHLNLDGLDWYKTWIPPKYIQDEFADIVIYTHRKTIKALKENRDLESLRGLVRPLLLNGQVSFE